MARSAAPQSRTHQPPPPPALYCRPDGTPKRVQRSGQANRDYGQIAARAIAKGGARRVLFRRAISPEAIARRHNPNEAPGAAVARRFGRRGSSAPQSTAVGRLSAAIACRAQPEAARRGGGACVAARDAGHPSGTSTSGAGKHNSDGRPAHRPARRRQRATTIDNKVTPMSGGQLVDVPVEAAISKSYADHGRRDCPAASGQGAAIQHSRRHLHDCASPVLDGRQQLHG